MFSIPIAVVGGRLLLIHMCGYFSSVSKTKKGLRIFQYRMPNRSWRIIYSFLQIHFFSLYCKHRINAFNWVPGISFINNKIIAQDIKEIINVSALTHLNLAGNSTVCNLTILAVGFTATFLNNLEILICAWDCFFFYRLPNCSIPILHSQRWLNQWPNLQEKMLN